MRKCICKRKVNVFIAKEGYFVGCSRCGRESDYMSTYEQAVENWNNLIDRPFLGGDNEQTANS